MEYINNIKGGNMIKVEVIETFNLERYNELKNIQRKGANTIGMLYVGDKFECEKELADYLLGDNPIKKAVVKVIEVIPEKKEIKEETKTMPKKKKKSTK